MANLSSQEVQRRAFDKVSKFFDGKFFMSIHQELGPNNAEWVMPVSFFQYQAESGLGGDFRYADCPAGIKTRQATPEDLAVCAAWQVKNNGKQYSIFFQPCPEIQPWIIMLDDLSREEMQKHKGEVPGRLIIESSPGNWQIWIRFDKPMGDEERVELMKKYGPDAKAATAIRHGRMPGFSNRKDKHEEAGYPFSKIEWCRFGRTTAEEFETVGYKTYDRSVPEPAPAGVNGYVSRTSSYHSSSHSQEPTGYRHPEHFDLDYNKYSKFSNGKLDLSATDYAFGLAARVKLVKNIIEYGPGEVEEKIIERIKAGRPDWRKYGGAETKSAEYYLRRTAKAIMSKDLTAFCSN